MLVHRNAQPFFRESKNTVFCLLIHGFTGSPADMSVLGDYLAGTGCGVSGILLPGHGTTPQHLNETTWQHWYAAVEQEYLRIRTVYQDAKVIPLGLSMGGLLALHLAYNYQVQGVVALSAPVEIAGVNEQVIAEQETEYYPKRKTPAEKEKDLAEGRFSYDVTPLKALLSLLQLIEKVKAELPSIRQPALILQSKDDRTVIPASAEFLYNNLASSEKKLIWLEKSGHVITLGMERAKVFEAVSQFIQVVCGPFRKEELCK